MFTWKGAGAPNAKKKASVRSGKSSSLVRSWSPSPSGKTWPSWPSSPISYWVGDRWWVEASYFIVAGVEHLVTQCGDGWPSEAMMTWRAQMDAIQLPTPTDQRFAANRCSIKSDRIWHFVMKKTGESTDVSHSIRKSPFKSSVRNSEKVSEICGSPSSSEMAMDQYLYIPFLGGWTSIYQLFWCSPGVQGFDPSPNLHDSELPNFADRCVSGRSLPSFPSSWTLLDPTGCVRFNFIQRYIELQFCSMGGTTFANIECCLNLFGRLQSAQDIGIWLNKMLVGKGAQGHKIS